jgi:uncharacterized protein with von Willebrand factor type A (vWA) domain
VGDALVSAVLRFADHLRDLGVDLPTSGVLDAMAALEHVELASRAETRVALATTLVKRSEDVSAFDAAFERWFVAPAEPLSGPPLAGTPPARPAGERPPGREAVDRELDDAREAAAIRDQLATALAAGDVAALADLAARAVRRWAGLDTVAGSDRYHMQRLLRGLDLSAIAQDALRRERGDRDRRSALEERLARADIEAQLDRLRRLLADELRARQSERSRRRAALEGREEPAPGRLDDVDFLRASTQELRQMRNVVRPLARKLAARVAQQHRRSRVGRLDMRRTLRASLESGGVPLDPAYRHRRRTRPELWMLCDVSGSVAEFSRFTLAFVYAMHEELSGLRTFVFVDDVEEITDVLDRRIHDVDPFGLLVRASASRAHHRSDYGQVLRQFLDRYGSQVTPRATLLITGDARTHHRDPGADALRALCHRARQVWFLNPEPRERWDQGDSVASLYAVVCDRMVEVRNLNQLADCVTGLL